MKPEKIDLNCIERLLPKLHAAITSSPCITDNAVIYSNVAGNPIMIYTQRKESIHIDDMKPLLKYIERIGTDNNGHLFFGLRTNQKR
jgi:hypothetical protein